jgi:antitoxin MazE
MEVRLKRWGNSFAVRIPMEVVKSMELDSDSILELSTDGKQLVLKPAQPGPRFSLDALLSEVEEKNLHSEIDTGEPAGEEAW